jgi:SAM-dependent methyltransferase
MTDAAALAGLDRDSIGAEPKRVNRQLSETASTGPLIVNLGCGVKTSERCVNVDWSIYIILHQNRWLLPLMGPLIRRDRVERVHGMRGKTICHNLRKGIPFPDNSVDAVYHSHLMEHIDRDGVPTFQKEIFRVLKPGGIQRICVPSLELYVSEYSASLAADDLTRNASIRHDRIVANILEQSVRRASQAAKGQRGLRVWLENLVLGDARARGETHQWMWDRVNLRAVLVDAGFVDVKVCSWNRGDIEGWQHTGLEVASDGSEYKPESMYLECRKP